MIMPFVFEVLIPVGISVVLLLLSLVFRVAAKLRLTLPIIYIILMAFVFNDWADKHEVLSIGILIVILVLVVISWIYSFIKAIRNRKRR